MSKPQTFDYFFSDEPQYTVPLSRAYCAAWLKSLRNISNRNRIRYAIRRTGKGQFTVQVNHRNAPLAIIKPALA